MRAIRVHAFGGPEVMALEKVDAPSCGRGEVLVQVHAAGVNPVDVYIRSGSYARTPPLPYTPGTDGAGTVVEVGEGVSRLAVGDRVYLDGSVTGTYAESALCREEQVQPLPANLTFEQGAALGVPYGTAYRALVHVARGAAGETVLVHGASGGTGTAAVQLAYARGLTVIGTAGSERGRQLVLAQGAAHALDHNDPDHERRLLELTQGMGVDVIVEMLANRNLGADLRMLSRGGRVAVVGSRGPVEINPRDAMGREAAILGVLYFHATPEDRTEAARALFEAAEREAVRPVIGHALTLAEAPRAHEVVMQPGASGKIVLTP